MVKNPFKIPVSASWFEAPQKSDQLVLVTFATPFKKFHKNQSIFLISCPANRQTQPNKGKTHNLDGDDKSRRLIAVKSRHVSPRWTYNCRQAYFPPPQTLFVTSFASTLNIGGHRVLPHFRHGREGASEARRAKVWGVKDRKRNVWCWGGKQLTLFPNSVIY